MKYLIVTILLAVSISAISQIPSEGFEKWNSTGGVYEDPEGWASLNTLGIFGFPPVVEKDTVSKEGKYALAVKTILYNQDTIPGVAFTGESKMNGFELEFKNGFPFTGRPQTISGYYKYFPAGKDTGTVSLTLTHYDSLTKSTVVVGSARLRPTETIKEFTAFNLTIDYDTTLVPDTAVLMVFSSSPVGPVPGSMIILDGLGFDVPTSVAKSKKDQIKVYPNPSNGWVKFSSEGKFYLEVFLPDGKIITKKEGYGEISMDYSPYRGKMILYRLRKEDSREMEYGKIWIIR